MTQTPEPTAEAVRGGIVMTETGRVLWVRGDPDQSLGPLSPATL